MAVPQFLTVSEAAQIQRVSEESILSWVERGELVGVRDHAGRLLIPRAAFDAFRHRQNLEIPESVLKRSTIAEALHEFEAHFGMTTRELLDLEAGGGRPDLLGPQDEMMYSCWKSLIRLAERNGSLAKSA